MLLAPWQRGQAARGMHQSTYTLFLKDYFTMHSGIFLIHFFLLTTSLRLDICYQCNVILFDSTEAISLEALYIFVSFSL